MLMRILILLCLSYYAWTQDEDTEPPGKRDIDSVTTTTLIPKVTEADETTTTDLSKVIFNKPELVTAELNEAWGDLNRTVYNSIANFMKYSKDKLEGEMFRIFSDLEKVDSYDKFEKLCPAEQITAFEEFQTSVDGLGSRWVLVEHGKIDDAIEAIYKSYVIPFRAKLRTDIESVITTALRYPRGNLEKFTTCANAEVPKCINFVETAFNNVVECLVMNMNYTETLEYQESITKLYEEVAGTISTCNGQISCLKRNCPKFHNVVIKVVGKAADAITTIIKHFREEVDEIVTCTKNRFNEKAFTANMTALTQEVRTCFGK